MPADSQAPPADTDVLLCACQGAIVFSHIVIRRLEGLAALCPEVNSNIVSIRKEQQAIRSPMVWNRVYASFWQLAQENVE